MPKEKVFKVTVKVQPPAAYKVIYLRGICVSQNKDSAKKHVINQLNQTKWDVEVKLTITKCELVPSKFIFNNTI